MKVLASSKKFLIGLALALGVMVITLHAQSVPNPVVYYPLNEMTGTTSADGIGSNNITITAGSGGWGDDGAHLGPSTTQFGCLGSTLAMTSGVSLGTTHSVVVSFHEHDGWAGGVILGGAPDNWALAIQPPGDLYYSAGSGNLVGPVSAGSIQSGFAYLGVVRNGPSVDFYRDGVQVGTTQTLGSNNAVTIDTLCNDDASSFAVQGYIDEVRMWNTNLSSAQMAAAATYPLTTGGGGGGGGSTTHRLLLLLGIGGH